MAVDRLFMRPSQAIDYWQFMTISRSFSANVARLLGGLALCLLVGSALAQTITSVVPARGAVGVSATAPVVFTFSEMMNPEMLLVVQFYDDAPIPNSIDSSQSWNANMTVLTCVPEPGFPVDAQINWSVLAMTASFNVVDENGTFQIESSPTGTNQFTSFSLGKSYSYGQTSTNLPTTPAFCYFDGAVSLASNRTAYAVTLKLPNNAVSNLVRNPLARENYNLNYMAGTPTALGSVFADGAYQFKVSASASNQLVSLSLPSFQPNAPGITNHTAAQAVDSTKDFRLGWTPFSGGTTGDVITLSLSAGAVEVTLPQQGLMNGTNTYLVIPTGTLNPDTTYDGYLTFTRFTATNNPTFTTMVKRSSTTQFVLKTTSSVAAVTLAHPTRQGASFVFDVRGPTGPLTIEYRKGFSTSWSPLVTTNSTGAWIRIADAQAATNNAIFYRARTGS